jgi:hypothetical protein
MFVSPVHPTSLDSCTPMSSRVFQMQTSLILISMYCGYKSSEMCQKLHTSVYRKVSGLSR